MAKKLQKRASRKDDAIIWQWEGDYQDQFFDYDKACSDLLEAAFNKGSTVCYLPSDSGTPSTEVYVRTLHLIDVRTRLRRGVQRLKTSSRQGEVQWQWEGDGPNEWILYDSDCREVLESGYLNRLSSVDLSQQGTQLPYIVHLDTMEQVNKYTGFPRNARRMYVTVPKPAAAAVTSRSSSPQRSRSSTASKQRSTVAVASVGQTAFQTPLSLTLGSSTQAAPASRQPYGKQPLKSIAPGSSSNYRYLSSTESSDDEDLPKDLGSAQPALSPELASLQDFFKDIGLTSSTDACPICLEELRSPSGYSDASSPMKGSRQPLAAASAAARGGQSSGSSDARAVVTFRDCKHQLHQICLLSLLGSSQACKTAKPSSFTCPTCNKVYGKKTGTCPPGNMTFSTLRGCSLPGYEGRDVIQITYSIASGIQGPEHPNPNRPYHAVGFPRVAFLPDSSKGRLVLKLLQLAWDQKLTFTIGTSVTTGAADMVTWNEVHHKTQMTGPHGYPDAEYLDRVLDELRAFGITEKDV